jgi:hypothetical protein
VIPHAGQQAVLNSTMRYRIASTSRRWGKSELLFMAASVYDPSRVLYICPNHKMSNVFLHGRSRGQALFTEYDIFHSDRHRGLQPKIVLIDEPAWMNPNLMNEIEIFIINGGRLLAIGTPVPRKKDETDLLIELMRRAKTKRHFFDSETWTFSIRSNPFVDIDASTIEGMTEAYFKCEVLGEFAELPEEKPSELKQEWMATE